MFKIMEHSFCYNILLHHMIRVTKPHILQRWIKAKIYNNESSKYGSNVVEHKTILCNLGYRSEPKVFIKIQGNQHNPYLC